MSQPKCSQCGGGGARVKSIRHVTNHRVTGGTDRERAPRMVVRGLRVCSGFPERAEAPAYAERTQAEGLAARNAIRSRGRLGGLVRWFALVPVCVSALAWPGGAASYAVVGSAEKPLGSDARRWQIPPRWWLVQAACIHRYETLGSRGMASWRLDTHNGFYGGFQFTSATWHSVGGSGLPNHATPAEQRYRAWINWNRNGKRWGGQQWPATAAACGLK